LLRTLINLPFRALGHAARAVQVSQDAREQARQAARAGDREPAARNVPQLDTPADYEPAGLGWSAAELALALQAEAPPLLVDVREGNPEGRAGLPGSEHLPLSTLGIRLAELPPEPRKLVFYDERGEAGREAARFVRFRGNEGAFYLAGGLRAWTGGGRSLETP
jgi:rhodanese-related sulfurtransferase